MAETNTYLDAAGQPLLRESVVAFIDVLGFSQMSVASTNQAEAQQVLNKISAAIEDSRHFARQLAAEQGAAQDAELQGRWSTKFFSDNLAFGYPLGESVEQQMAGAWFIVRCAQRYQLKMTLNGYFVRGALTKGLVCLTDEIIFGSALIESYQLESKTSIVPRIVLAKPLQELLLQSHQTKAGLFARAPQAICRDVDGWWFVNYLDAAIQDEAVQWPLIAQHRASILESLSHTTRHDVLPKYGWACRYHNLFCHWHRHDPGYSDDYRVHRSDEESTMLRLAEHRP